MKLLTDALAEQGFYGPFHADTSCVRDRGGYPVLIVSPTVEGVPARTDLAEAVARALNAQTAAERVREAA